MKFAFENTLKQYHELGRTAAQAEAPEGQSDQELQELYRWATKKFGTTSLTQEEIFALQQSKREVMDRLRNDLRLLDSPEEEPPYRAGERPAHWHDGRLITLNLETKSEESCSVGELMTDGEWGLSYHLDRTTPRHIRKRYLVERAKTELRRLLDEQIATNEADSCYNDPFKRQAYQHVRAITRQEERLTPGLIAERLVGNFLKKISIDLARDGEAPDFEIVHADAYQDVENKIDFIIRRKSRRRGVKVEERAGTGVQFTIQQKEELLRHKQEQIARAKERSTREDGIDDIVLVSLPLGAAAKHYETWKRNRAAGGPDKLWTKADKQAIFRGVMGGILSEQEIENYCSKLNQTMPGG